MGGWTEPTEQEALERLRDVLAEEAEAEIPWTLPFAMLYPADPTLGENAIPIRSRHTLAELRDLADAVNAYGNQGYLWPSSVKDALRDARQAGFNPYRLSGE